MQHANMYSNWQIVQFLCNIKLQQYIIYLYIIHTADEGASNNEEASATGAEATGNTSNARVQQQPNNESEIIFQGRRM